MTSVEPPIRIPDPSLVVLVGPAGAGKTTFAARWFAPDEVVGSDALRAAIAGDASDRSRDGAVFAALHRTVGARAADGRLTVVDATNLDHRARRDLLRLAAVAHVPAVAILLAVTLEEALAHDVARPGRQVGEPVVAAQHGRLVRLLEQDALADEGFAAVHVLVGAGRIASARLERIGSDARTR